VSKYPAYHVQKMSCETDKQTMEDRPDVASLQQTTTRCGTELPCDGCPA